MDENKAWEVFCKSGKVVDYIKYSALNRRQQTGVAQQGGYMSNADNHKRDCNKAAQYR